MPRLSIQYGSEEVQERWRSTLMNSGAILQKHAHRQTPLPRGEWMLRQSWRELLFAHWPMAAQALRPLLPAALTLDTFEREAWVWIVPFQMRAVCPPRLPPFP